MSNDAAIAFGIFGALIFLLVFLSIAVSLAGIRRAVEKLAGIERPPGDGPTAG